MKRYVITRFAAGNIANLGSVSFTSEGEDVTITGQNGAGKSTVKKAISWILAGSTSDGEKLIPYDNAAMPFAELELYDGVGYVTFRKEMVENRDSDGKISRTARCYVQGLISTQKELQDYFNRIVPADIFKIMISLFGFTSLKPAEQRAILLNHFAKDTDRPVFNATFNDMDFNSPEKFIEVLKKENFKLKKSAEKIAVEIEVLQKDCSFTTTPAFEILKVYEAALERVKKNIAADKVACDDLTDKKTARNLRKSQIQFLQKELVQLRKKWQDANINSTCPTCGQTFPPRKIQKFRQEIADAGIAKKKELEENLAALKVIKKSLEDAQVVFEKFNRLCKVQTWLAYRIKSLKDRNGRCLTRETRIETLKADARATGDKITENEREIALAETFIGKKCECVTKAINSNFKRVKFKMFETSKSGEVSNTCEAMLNGVPYAYLSKGEKFTATLDILGAFQKHFGAALPLIVDDAESYTSQTIADYESLPNQKILLKVTDGELKITVGRENA